MKKKPSGRSYSYIDVMNMVAAAKKKKQLEYMTIILTALHDKEGFERDDLARLIQEVNDISDSIREGYIKIEDLADTLRDELNMTFSIEENPKEESDHKDT